MQVAQRIPFRPRLSEVGALIRREAVVNCYAQLMYMYLLCVWPGTGTCVYGEFVVICSVVAVGDTSSENVSPKWILKWNTVDV